MRNSPMNRPRNCGGTTSLNRYQNTEFTNMLNNWKSTRQTAITPIVTVAGATEAAAGTLRCTTCAISWLHPSMISVRVRKGIVQMMKGRRRPQRPR